MRTPGSISTCSLLKQRLNVHIDRPPFEGASLQVEHRHHLVLSINAQAILLNRKVYRYYARHPHAVDTEDLRKQRVLVVSQVVEHIRQHLDQLLFLLAGHALDDVLPVLGEEEEATALASLVVLLAFVGLEDLEPVLERVDGLDDGSFVHIAEGSNHLEHLGSVGVYPDVVVDLFELVSGLEVKLRITSGIIRVFVADELVDKAASPDSFG